jgi:polar amino acid transport system substrate-binding protein
MHAFPTGRRPAYRSLAWAVLLLACCGGSIVLSAQSEALRLVSTAWPPFTNQPGQARFALDLVEAALGRIGVSSSTTIVDAAQFTTSLLGGEFDGSAAAWKDSEREVALIFSQPYLENRLIVVGRKGADVSAASLAALKGQRVTLVEGYSYGAAVENAGPVFVRARSEEDSLSRLLAGSVDFVLMDEVVVQYIVDHHALEAQTRLQFGSTPVVIRPLHFAVRRSLPGAQSIIDRFNAQLRGMIADRTYHRLLHVDWIRADVDGDGLFEYVPGSDAPRAEPQRAYSVFSPTAPSTTRPSSSSQADSSKSRFYVGGHIYEEWATVPDHFKLLGNNYMPNPARSTGTVFRFVW